MKINLNEWKLFLVGDMFDIHPTKAYPNLTIADLDDGGNTPVIVNSAENNGVGGHSFLPPTESKGIITFSDTTEGNTFFYQDSDFIGFSHVQGMYPINRIWSEKELLFLVSILKFSNSWRYNYGRKMRRDNISKSYILLPQDENGMPDYKFMSDYIDSLKSKHVTTINKPNNISLNTLNWKYFKIGDYFDVSLSSGDLKINDCAEGKIPLISSDSSNNGYIGYIDQEGDGLAEIFSGNKITVDMFCNAFYQEKDFYSVSHGRVNILTPRFEMDKNIALFIVTIINKEQFKYSYGRAVYSSEICNMLIKLPSINNRPDWDYMKNYISNLPYAERI